MENERIEAILFTTDRYEFFMCADPYAHRPAMTVKKAVKAAKVIFNDPATVVIWDDGTKTVVKCCEGEDFDPEKGLALCYMKKYLGEEYKTVLHREIKRYEEDKRVASDIGKFMAEFFSDIAEKLRGEK